MANKLKWTIISIFDYFKFLLFMFSVPRNSKFLIVVSHDATVNGGAPVVLNELLNHMNLHNYIVVVLCKNGGNLMKKSDYRYFVYQYIPQLYFFVLKHFSVRAVLVNTIICSNVIKIVQKNYRCPIVWWIHEGMDLFNRMKDKLPDKINNNVKVLCVSNATQKVFMKFYPNCQSSILHYGINDSYEEKNERKQDRDRIFKIGVVGMLCERKNQMQIIHLLNKLPRNIAKRIRITVISGTWDKNYKREFLSKSKEIKQIKFIPGLSHDKLMQMYNDFNLLLCCSKFDPLPVVVTEAMMMKCLCLVSSGCGQYTYIENGKNGYKYDVNDLNMLVDRLTYIVSKVGDEQSLLNNARKLYLKEFSMEQAVKKMSTYLHL